MEEGGATTHISNTTAVTWVSELLFSLVVCLMELPGVRSVNSTTISKVGQKVKWTLAESNHSSPKVKTPTVETLADGERALASLRGKTGFRNADQRIGFTWIECRCHRY